MGSGPSGSSGSSGSSGGGATDDAAGAHEHSGVPRLLSHRADPAPLPSPVQESDEISSLHVKFARLVNGTQVEPADAGSGSGGGGTGTGGVRAKVRARVAAVARADAGADREFMGNLVRAVAALAERVDVVTTRVGELELLVQDVFDRLSEDLARAQIALGGADDGEEPET